MTPVRRLAVALAAGLAAVPVRATAGGPAGPAQPPPESATAYEAAARRGDPRAAYMWAVSLEQGRGVERDVGEAVRWYRRAALAGCAPAQNNLGYLYATGVGVDPDDALAFAWFVRSAGNRSADGWNRAPAWRNLGLMYYWGRGVPQETRRAAECWLRAAALGDRVAMDDLAWLDERGAGVREDLGAALSWYRRAADAGSSLGARNLGVLYETGAGVPRDPRIAFAWYSLAAKRGSAYAAERLGALFEAGRGTRTDRVEALAWYGLAAGAGDPRAAAAAERLRGTLTTADAAAADQRLTILRLGGEP